MCNVTYPGNTEPVDLEERLAPYTVGHYASHPVPDYGVPDYELIDTLLRLIAAMVDKAGTPTLKADVLTEVARCRELLAGGR